MTQQELNAIYHTTHSVISSVIGNYPANIQNHPTAMTLDNVTIVPYQDIHEIPETGSEFKYIFTIKFDEPASLRIFLIRLQEDIPFLVRFNIEEVHGIYLCVIFR